MFFATDVHGSDDCFRKFLTAAKQYKADILVLGGDITGKAVVPVVRQSDGGWTTEFLGQQRRLSDEGEVAQLEVLINRSGSYPFRTDVEETQEIQASRDRDGRIDEIAHELMSERARRWVSLAEERLAASDVRVFVGAGNDDPYDIDDILNASSRIVNPHDRVVRLDEHHEMIGIGNANPTPWDCPRDVSEEELAARLENVIRNVEDVSNAVFCVHVPPVDSTLDTCPKLDASTYPPEVVTDAAGEPIMFGAGSTAVRDAIERYQPLVGLHGHIHESRGVVNIGRTQAFNPGSEYGEGVLRGVIVNLTEDKLLSYQFTSG